MRGADRQGANVQLVSLARQADAAVPGQARVADNSHEIALLVVKPGAAG